MTMKWYQIKSVKLLFFITSVTLIVIYLKRSNFRSKLIFYFKKSNFNDTEELVNNISGFSSNWENVIKGRKDKVNEICSKYFKPLQRTDVSLLWHSKVPLGYCRNAKAGTSSWLSLFFKWHSDEKIPPEDVHSLAKTVFASKNQNFKEFLLFSVVRHPFLRLVSAYREKILKSYNIDEQQKMITKYRNSTDLSSWNKISEIIGINVSHYPTFREFSLNAADEVLECRPMESNSVCLSAIDLHWRPYFDRCGYCNVQYDIISKVETFDNDAKYIILRVKELLQKQENIKTNYSTYKLEKLKSYNGTHTNIINLLLKKLDEVIISKENFSQGPSTIKLAKLFYDLLTTEEIQKIYSAYYIDYQMFSYDEIF